MRFRQAAMSAAKLAANPAALPQPRCRWLRRRRAATTALPQPRCRWLCRRRAAETVAAAAVAFDSIVIFVAVIVVDSDAVADFS